MGWETTLLTHIRFSHKTYDYKYQVEDDIAELGRSIKMCEQKLRDLSMMTEPDKMLKVIGEDDSETNGFNAYELIDEYLQDLFDILHEDIVERAKLLLLLEEWDKCHDKETGLAINEPDNIDCEDSFLDGDFVKSVKKPNANDISSLTNVTQL